MDISESKINSIEREYNIKISQKEQLYTGADKDTFVFKIKTEDNRYYFMKIRTGHFIETSVTIPYLLSKTFGGNIIRSIKTIKGHLFMENPVGNYLYLKINGWNLE
jgi:hypothetical protein